MDDTDFTPDPTFSANRFLRLWGELGLPFPHSVHWSQHELALRDLHLLWPHWSPARIEAAFRRLAADKDSGDNELKWAWANGPIYLATKRRNKQQTIEVVLGWDDRRFPTEPEHPSPRHQQRLRPGDRPMTGRERLLREYETTRLRRPDDDATDKDDFDVTQL